MITTAEWKKQFNIGVDSIDHAHRKLFSIVRKLIHLSEDENNGPWACAEGIKYFKSYAIQHFTDEEAYMQSIGYQGYEVHKHLHDDMRSKTLPALEKDLLESNYSQESIHHFIGICLGWLTAHIMIEDRAITGKISNRWKKDNAGKNITALEGALTDFVQKIWGLPAEIVSEHYNGENFGNSMIVRLIYRSKEKKKIQIFLVLEESLILHTVSSMLDMPLTKMDKLVANAVRELSQQIADQIILHFRLSLQYQLESSHFMTPEQFQTEFSAEYFSYSLLFNTGTGYFAFCIK
ncbi:MAG: hemerythrin family protein [Kineothrix sp.]|jgi:hemerythrin-like metal-binding protein|nr:hemerythrin family protein [Kineothrix sp.]